MEAKIKIYCTHSNAVKPIVVAFKWTGPDYSEENWYIQENWYIPEELVHPNLSIKPWRNLAFCDENLPKRLNSGLLGGNEREN